MGLILNLRGPSGAVGAAGANGAAGSNGTNGATWTSGTGVPADTLGSDGDFYLRTDTGDVYKKVAGTWA